MNRVYLMPKVIFITLVLIFFTGKYSLPYILLFLFCSLLLTAILILLRVYILGKYYAARIKKGKPVDREKLYRFVVRHIKMVNALMRVHIDVEGLENMKPGENYYITPNHQSQEDILVILEAIQTPVLFVSKYSMSQVIMVKDWMFILECLFLNKDDLRGQMLVMRDVTQKLTEGKNVVLFPEGKRSFASELNEFKPGAFKVALRTEKPILPVTLNHVYKLRHHFPWKRTYISIHIHKPIYFEEYKDLNTTELADLVKATIESKIIA